MAPCPRRGFSTPPIGSVYHMTKTLAHSFLLLQQRTTTSVSRSPSGSSGAPIPNLHYRRIPAGQPFDYDGDLRHGAQTVSDAAAIANPLTSTHRCQDPPSFTSAFSQVCGAAVATPPKICESPDLTTDLNGSPQVKILPRSASSRRKVSIFFAQPTQGSDQKRSDSSITAA